jgi:hypothetical protein
MPKSYDPFLQPSVIKFWKLKGIEYGNWLNQEDRYNYFMALQIALFDLSKVLGFKNIGLDGNVGVSFGARGKSAALAHFEPDTNMINLTRFKEAKKILNPFTLRPVFGKKTTYEIKDILFEKTGGMGSFGHEYAHALDYFFGGYIEPDFRKKYRSLTMGRSIVEMPLCNYPVNSMRLLANKIVKGLIWDMPGEKYTHFYAKLKVAIANKKLPGGKYWIRHNELFARVFEVYLSQKLKEKRIKNTFLISNKYEGISVYPDAALTRKITPLFDELIKKMAKEANKK